MRRVRDGEHQLRHRLALERQSPREHLVERDAEREEIRAPVDLAARELLGRHVRRRAEHHAGLGLRRIGDARDAEVRHLHGVALRLVHDVRGLDVAVDDAHGVRVAERIGDALDEGEDLVRREEVRLLRVLDEILALEVLHRDVAEVVLLARVEDGDDVRVVEAPGRFRLAEEALLGVGELVRLEFRRERHRLDRDDATDLRILAAIHDAHRALAELFLHLVTPEHRLLGPAALQDHRARVGARRRRAAEDDRLGQALRAVHPFLDVVEPVLALVAVDLDRALVQGLARDRRIKPWHRPTSAPRRPCVLPGSRRRTRRPSGSACRNPWRAPSR